MIQQDTVDFNHLILASLISTLPDNVIFHDPRSFLFLFSFLRGMLPEAYVVHSITLDDDTSTMSALPALEASAAAGGQ